MNPVQPMVGTRGHAPLQTHLVSTSWGKQPFHIPMPKAPTRPTRKTITLCCLYSRFSAFSRYLVEYFCKEDGPRETGLTQILSCHVSTDQLCDVVPVTWQPDITCATPAQTSRHIWSTTASTIFEIMLEVHLPFILSGLMGQQT